LTDKKTRAGFVALIGEPNAGKSTLLNALVGAKLSIVTHKVQTTRGRVRGVLNSGPSQIIFVDTPGLFEPRRTLDRAMVSAAWSAVAEADAVLLLVEAHRGMTEGVGRILKQLADRVGSKTPVSVAINKIDRVKRPALLDLASTLREEREFEEVFFISATKEDGLDDIVGWLSPLMEEGAWLYPDDQIGDTPMRMIAAEITREKLMLRLHQELPYQLTVATEKWEERRDGSVRIEQIVLVAKESHRAMVVGKGGQTIKQVGQAAREELAEMLGHPVHLFLHVKEDPKWLEDRSRYAEFGIDGSDS